MNHVIKVGDSKPGDIIETICDGMLTGNIYKVGQNPGYFGGKIRCWKRFRQGPILLHPSVSCVVVDPNTDIPLNF